MVKILDSKSSYCVRNFWQKVISFYMFSLIYICLDFH